MSQFKFVLIAFLGFSLATTAVGADVAGDAKAGKTKSAACAACHGPKGINATGGFPNLAGQNEVYVVTALKAYRAKTRKADIMNTIAGALDDQDIANLAAYYRGLSPCP